MLLLDVLYGLGAVVGFPALLWLLFTKPRVRHGLLERFGLKTPRRRDGRPCIWVHAVSVGEVNAAKPLIKEIERQLPGYDVVISCTTSTGMSVAKKCWPDRTTFYFPLDFSFATRRVLRALRPELVVLVELELWPNFLYLARRRGVPVMVVNGRISARSVRGYLWVRWLLRWPLGWVVWFCVQAEVYRERFLRLGVEDDKVIVTGSVKYDALPSAPTDPPPGGPVRRALGIADEAPVLVGGSIHPGEEAVLVRAYQALRREHPELRLVLVPRHVERAGEMEAVIRRLGEHTVRKTALDAGLAAGLEPGEIENAKPFAEGEGRAPVVLCDTTGELIWIYAAADVVFVGGSLIPHGGQNMLEPCALGKAVAFGPHTDNFREIADGLVEARAALRVEDEAELTARVRELLDDRSAVEAMGARARAAVDAKRGASRRTVARMRALLCGESSATGGAEEQSGTSGGPEDSAPSPPRVEQTGYP